MQSPNFLILDEPTNDLDIHTLQVLEEYLASFKGCVIIISHDRYFMDKTVDHLLVFEGDGIVTQFPSSYSDFIEWKRLKEAEERKKLEEERNKNLQKSSKTDNSQSKKSDKLTYKEKREMESIEGHRLKDKWLKRIQERETRQKEIAQGTCQHGQRQSPVSNKLPHVTVDLFRGKINKDSPNQPY